MKIVIVEDCQIMHLSLKLRLDEIGYDIVGTATSKETAIPLIIEAEPDIVLMDVELENSNGLDIINSLKGKTDAKFIVLTMHKDESEFFSVIDANAYAYCNKAVDIEQLDDIIQKVYRGEYWLDPIIGEI